MRFDNRSRVSTYLNTWMPTGDEVAQSITVDYLVVAGGGGNGREDFLLVRAVAAAQAVCVQLSQQLVVVEVLSQR